MKQLFWPKAGQHQAAPHGGNKPLAFIVSFNNVTAGKVYPPGVYFYNEFSGVPQVLNFGCTGGAGIVGDFTHTSFGINARAMELAYVSGNDASVTFALDRDYSGAYWTVENLFNAEFTVDLWVLIAVNDGVPVFDTGRFVVPRGRSVIQIDSSHLDNRSTSFSQASIELQEPGRLAISEVAVI
ncbi:hypothetical protein FIV34_18770 [Luteibacter pinisoli]|uniref:Uncharacterized protein n=1 Tax=Luteibacter pinisoli TaxID=2589080 RepID=A0A4Y5Z716_9GAMM|nr:hypothetical protein [Luteibacter pinisoli]QDE41101.1 hypothetical protein FIV34_18770 [Luteibacter pinisoli]